MTDAELTEFAKRLGYAPVCDSEGALACFKSEDGHALAKSAVDYAAQNPEYAARVARNTKKTGAAK